MQCDHSGTLAIGTCSPLFNHLHFLEGSTLVHTAITWPCLVSWGLFRCGCRALPCWQQALPLGCPSYNCIYSPHASRPRRCPWGRKLSVSCETGTPKEAESHQQCPVPLCLSHFVSPAHFTCV